MKNFVLLLLLSVTVYGGYYYYKHAELPDIVPENLWKSGKEQSSQSPTTTTTGGTVTPRSTTEEKQADTDVLRHRSERGGLTFWYPARYFATEQNVGTKAEPQISIVLMENTPENRDLVESRATEPRETPPQITVDVYVNTKKRSALEWAKEDQRWAISTKKTADISVGGVEGVSFVWDGIYHGKSAVVVVGDKAYVVSVEWLSPTDPIRADYAALTSSMVFDE